MKKIITLVALVLGTVLGYAQKIYYGDVTRHISVGVGHFETFSPDIIFSVMISDHSPQLEKYDIRVYDETGYGMPDRLTRVEDVYTVKSGHSRWSHMIDFRIKHGDWKALLNDMRHGYASISIDGTLIGGCEFYRIIDELERDRQRTDLPRHMIWMSTPPTQVYRYHDPRHRPSRRLIRRR